MRKQVRVRMAPSPTGFLHVGGVRTALFNYLFAKKHGGKFILRLEDTDRERFVEAGVKQIVESLQWLELVPDEGFWLPKEKGEHAPYVQSQRLPKYHEYAQQLMQAGLAYYSPTSQEDLEKLRGEARQNKQPFLYRKKLDKNNSDQAVADVPIRLDVEAATKKVGDRVDWQDEVRGSFSEDLDLVEDFILIKSDGYPTYNFANVIDDHLMKITHVIRGDEFISSTGKHALLYDLFSWPRPMFAHPPDVLGSDHKKLSKRTGDTDVLEYQAKGYMPEALLNFLALLGWNDGSEKEVFSLDEMVQAFSLERVQKSPAVFDTKRLDWMNGLYIRNASFEELLQRAASFWPKSAAKFDHEYKQRILRAVQDRLERFEQLPELTNFFFELPAPSKAVKAELIKVWKDEKHSQPHWLEQVAKLIETEAKIIPKNLEAKLRNKVAAVGGKPAALFGTLRIALTQADQTPPIWDIVYALGKTEAIKRLQTTAGIL